MEFLRMVLDPIQIALLKPELKAYVKEVQEFQINEIWKQGKSLHDRIIDEKDQKNDNIAKGYQEEIKAWREYAMNLSRENICLKNFILYKAREDVINSQNLFSMIQNLTLDVEFLQKQRQIENLMYVGQYASDAIKIITLMDDLKAEAKQKQSMENHIRFLETQLLSEREKNQNNSEKVSCFCSTLNEQMLPTDDISCVQEILRGIVVGSTQKQNKERPEVLLENTVKMMLNRHSSKDLIVKWIDTNMDVDGKSFIRSLTSTVIEHCVSGSSEKVINMELLDSLLPLLDHFVHCDEEKELQVLFAVQELIAKLHYPQGMASKIFSLFCCEDLISELTFIDWRDSEDDQEQTGRGVMILETLEFFSVLEEPDEVTEFPSHSIFSI